MSICQALESDDEEDEDKHHYSSGRRGQLPRTVSDPHELSSALMKALRVGQEEEGKLVGRGEGRREVGIFRNDLSFMRK